MFCNIIFTQIIKRKYASNKYTKIITERQNTHNLMSVQTSFIWLSEFRAFPTDWIYHSALYQTEVTFFIVRWSCLSSHGISTSQLSWSLSKLSLKIWHRRGKTNSLQYRTTNFKVESSVWKQFQEFQSPIFEIVLGTQSNQRNLL